MNQQIDAYIQALGTQIRVELAERSWTQIQLAEKVGVTRETLGKYMKGQRDMPMPVFYEIATAFGYSPRGFMELVERRALGESR